MSKRTIILTDIHGCIEPLTELIDKLNITDNDDCICLGDITDKGPSPIECARLLMLHNFELTASNHDDRYVKFLKKGKSANEILPNSKAISADAIKQTYAEILDAPDVAEYLLSKKAYIQRTIAGRLVTMVHAGVMPSHDLYNMTSRAYNEIIRVRYLDKDSHEMTRMVRVDGKFSDESPSWRPETDNIIEWQKVYDERYGVIVHGHNIVNNPVLWSEPKFEGPTKKVDNLLPTLIARLSDWRVISIDTGAFKGNKLTALVINNDGVFNFEQVNCNTVYSF